MSVISERTSHLEELHHLISISSFRYFKKNMMQSRLRNNKFGGDVKMHFPAGTSADFALR